MLRIRVRRSLPLVLASSAVLGACGPSLMSPTRAPTDGPRGGVVVQDDGMAQDDGAPDDGMPDDDAPVDELVPDDDGAAGEGPPPASVPPSGPRRFTARLSNIAPWTVFKSGVANIPVGKTAPGPIRAGDAYEVVFTAGKPHRLSFVAMLGASNDWFYGTPPEGIPLYVDGVARSEDVTALLRLYDSGTEIDEEPGVGASTGPKQATPEAGAPDALGYVRALPNPVQLSDGSMFALPALSEVLRVTITPVGDRAFRLRIENVSEAGALATSEGNKDIGVSPTIWVLHAASDPLFTVGAADRGQGLELLAESGRAQTLGDAMAAASGVATGFSPGVYVVHDRGAPLFSLGQPDRGQGLEQIAEAGNTAILDDALGTAFPEGASAKAVFNIVDDADAPGPVRPGQTYTFSFTASPGDRLSFASMFGASNDWIVGTPEDGVALFEANGAARAGDFTGELHFYDVGTEIDEEPAVGAHTGPNQSAPDDGPADAIGTVRVLPTTAYPLPVAAHLELTITPEAI
jgi:hypothetical protein